jgi:hypothetical protein
LYACLALCAACAFALRLALMLELPSIHRPDEVFQALEPAHRLWSGFGVVTWEWRDGIRSWLFPGAIAGLMAVASHVGPGPEIYLPVIAGALSLLSLGVVATGVALGWRHHRLAGAVLCGVLCTVWPELVYFAPRTLSEVQAGNLLVVAAGLASVPRETLAGRRGAARDAAIGALLGVVFALRFQLAPAAAVVALCAGRADVRRAWPALAAGAALPLATLGLCDWIAWGTPFQSVWKNLVVNLVERRSEIYGVEPPGWYLVQLVRLWGAAFLPVALFFVLGASRAPVMALVAAAVVLPHSLIAHKEISFIYAALPPIMITAGLGTARVLAWLRGGTGPAPQRAALPLVLAAAGLWTAVAALTAESGLAPMWARRSAMLALLHDARQRPDLCGVGLLGSQFLWHITGGYAYLDRPVPLYLLHTPVRLAAARAAVNYLIVAADAAAEVGQGYEAVAGEPGWRLMRRDGSCIAADPEDEINAVLARDGQ